VRPQAVLGPAGPGAVENPRPRRPSLMVLHLHLPGRCRAVRSGLVAQARSPTREDLGRTVAQCHIRCSPAGQHGPTIETGGFHNERRRPHRLERGRRRLEEQGRRKRGVEHHIHNQDGKVSARNSYGKDPSVGAADSKSEDRERDNVAALPPMPARFLTIKQVAEEPSIGEAQVYAPWCVARTLSAVKIGGRGRWRIERACLEEWISGSTATPNGFSTSTPSPAPATSAPATRRRPGRPRPGRSPPGGLTSAATARSF
jgi:Helix-turn-helix domain